MAKMTKTREQLDALRASIVQLERDLKEVKAVVLYNETQCRHQWGSAIQLSETRAETRNGAPVYRGSDLWYETIYVDIRVTVWDRECSKCGKIERTDKTKNQVITVPNF